MNAIPVSVLIDICKAISADKWAMKRADEGVTVEISPEFSQNMVSVILNISDAEVRRWAWAEIQGVEHE